MSKLRLLLIVLIGVSLTFLTYNSKYWSDILEYFAWLFFVFIGIGIFIWTLIADLHGFRKERRFELLVPTMVALAFIGTLLIMETNIAMEFEKPTLIEVYYSGDMDGIGIDFKSDGTYIFSSSSLFSTAFTYGQYQINKNQIKLDRKNIENTIVSENLEIVEKADEHFDEKQLHQKDPKGNDIDKALFFRITVDNRK